MSDYPPPDAFAAALALVSMAVDPKATQARLFELQKLQTEIVLAQGKLASDRAAHAAEVAKAKSDLSAMALYLVSTSSSA